MRWKLHCRWVHLLGDPELLLQILQFRERQHAVVTRPQAVNRDIGEVRAREPENRVADGFAEATNLAIFPLFERQLEPRLLALDAKHSYVDWLGRLAVDDNRLFEPFDLVFGHLALNLGDVDLLYLALRVDQTHRKVAIVGKEEHTARREVQAPDRHEPTRHSTHERRHRNAALRIIGRADRSSRLVKQNVDHRLSDEALAIELDALPSRVSLGT